MGGRDGSGSDNGRALPLWRSMLFVPVLNERFVAKAAARGADAVQLDLEDSIPPCRKADARAAVQKAAAGVAGAGVDVVVRINRPWRLAVPDIEAAVGAHVVALNLPKVPDAGHVRAIAEILDELEAERGLRPGHTGLVLMIETARALLDMSAIAEASDRVLALAIGAEDLAADMGMQPVPDALHGPSVQAVAAARAAGCLPIGYLGSVAQYADEAALAATARQARALGFEGGFCIHPRQVSILNAAFSPSAAEVEEAEALIAAHELAVADGRGAIAFRGRMLDAAVVARARNVMRRHEAILASGRPASSR